MSGTTQPSGSPASAAVDSLSNEIASNGEDYVETQRSLQQAALALEAAYGRIRQVRRSLLQLSESLPNPETLLRLTHNEIRPDHEALLLSGNGLDNRDAGDGHLFNLDMGLAAIPQPSVTTGARATRDHPRPHSETSFTFQSLPIPSVLPPRLYRQNVVNDWQPLQQLQSRGGIPDFAATTRGLRVAAREANLPEMGVDFAAVAAEYDRLLQAGQRLNLAPPDNNNAISARSRNAEIRARNAEVRDARRAAPSPPPSNGTPTTAALRPDPRRWRNRPDPRTSARPFTFDASMSLSERVQSYSDIMNRTLAIYPPTDIPNFPPISDPRAPARPRHPAEPNRLYPEAFRSDDIGSSVNIDWTDEEFISWLFPGQDYLQFYRDFPTLVPRRSDQPQNADTVRITRSTDTAVSPPDNLPPRRGWARLDPDGNEIPYNEEEELERSRTEYRLRALHRAQQNNTVPSSNHSRSEVHQAQNGRTIYGSVMDSTLNAPAPRQQASASAIPQPIPPFFVDPLPMPLASMVMTPEKSHQDDYYPDVIVPIHACLAGR